MSQPLDASMHMGDVSAAGTFQGVIKPFDPQEAYSAGALVSLQIGFDAATVWLARTDTHPAPASSVVEGPVWLQVALPVYTAATPAHAVLRLNSAGVPAWDSGYTDTGWWDCLAVNWLTPGPLRRIQYRRIGMLVICQYWIPPKADLIDPPVGFYPQLLRAGFDPLPGFATEAVMYGNTATESWKDPLEIAGGAVGVYPPAHPGRAGAFISYSDKAFPTGGSPDRSGQMLWPVAEFPWPTTGVGGAQKPLLNSMPTGTTTDDAKWRKL